MKVKQIFESYKRQNIKLDNNAQYCPRCGVRFDLKSLVIVLLAEKINGEPTPGDDIIKLDWFPL